MFISLGHLASMRDGIGNPSAESICQYVKSNSRNEKKRRMRLNLVCNSSSVMAITFRDKGADEGDAYQPCHVLGLGV